MVFYRDFIAEERVAGAHMHMKTWPKIKHMHIKLEQRLKESMFLPLNCRLVSKEKGNLILNRAGTRFNIHGVPPFFVQLHCQSAMLKALCEATKSGLQLLSTSVLPFPSSLLSLSLSLVITVKVQLRCLPWELSQRCVTAMWCFTRWVTKPPVVIHTCGISKSSPHMHTQTQTHTTVWSYHLLPVDTLPQVHFYLTRHRRNQFNSCYPGTVLTGSRKKKHSFTASLYCFCLFILSENFAAC